MANSLDQQTVDIKIINTTIEDLEKVLWLFGEVLKLNDTIGYKVWDTIDENALAKDIQKGFQYKIVKGDDITCVFTVLVNDPHIWLEKDTDKAVYLHRIVVHPDYRGQKQFEKVLAWAKQFAKENSLDYIRMDTWAENAKIINYYASFGFRFIGYYKTADTEELPIQNRNQHLALLELKLNIE